MPVKKRIIIIGGGCGGISAAFWLSSTAALRDRFDITVYTRGWRLGGKGASGRNTSISNRIEEHGLHMWMGCYANAFRTLCKCYAEWQPSSESQCKSLKDAFTPQFQVTLEQMKGNGSDIRWKPWNFVFPELPGELGDPPPSFPQLIKRFAQWLTNHLRNNVAPFGCIGNYEAALDALVSASQTGDKHEIAVALKQLKPVAAKVELALMAVLTMQESIMAPGMKATAPPELLDLERNLILANLGLAIALGVATDLLPNPDQGFDTINALDLRAWLCRHGATDASVCSAVVRALYDLGFAYPGGDSSNFSNGRGAAGVALRFVLEFALAYKGSPLWKMNAGMGDTIFTPMYEVLRARGVTINFFHRLTDVGLGSDRLETITMQRQADLLTNPYRPFIRVNGMNCWPSEPDWTQLINGGGLRAENTNFECYSDPHFTKQCELRADVDFDAVVLAIPPEMLRLVAPSLSVIPEWARMLANTASVATQAFQLWLKPTLRLLGWDRGPTVLTAYAEPFDTWADMTHLLQAETWIGPNSPGSIAYFCGAMALPHPFPPSGGYTAAVQDNAATWLQRNIATIWPKAGRPGQGVDPTLIVSQYYRCNSEPSELYVQTLPGSVQHRLAPRCGIVPNLFLAGDWTLTRYSSGCVEAAIESGMLASQALSGIPSL
jgi:uncharacterized protein with NAD-binding domain and iron-sulfur cluster